MRRVWLCATALAAMSAPARAQFVVQEPVLDTLGQLGLVNQYQQLLRWVDQLRAMAQQYQMLTQQYQAIAHLPDRVAEEASLLRAPTMQDPLGPIDGAIGLINGSSAQMNMVGSLAQRFAAQNTYYAPTGDDIGAQEMRRQAQGIAGVQAIATNNLCAVQQRQASLNAFLNRIGSAPDLQQTAAIQARLQLEQNFIAGQQVQAQQLALLATEQQRADQQRDQEMARKASEDWARRTADAFTSNGD